MADEITSHTKEELAICLRFVDKNKEIREEFVKFSLMATTSGKAVANEIISTLEEFDIDVSNARGQGYDGAASMSSERVGVQSRIREKSSKAVYTHCCNHSLNLVISHSCTIQGVHNCIVQLKDVNGSFTNSPKKTAFLEVVVHK